MLRPLLTFSMIGLITVVSFADEPERERRDQPRPRAAENRDAAGPRDADRGRDGDRPRDADRRREGDRDRDGDRPRDSNWSRDGVHPGDGLRPENAHRRDDQNHDRMVAGSHQRLQELRRMHERLADQRPDGEEMERVRQELRRAEQMHERLTHGNRPPGERGPGDFDRDRREQTERLEHLHIAAEHLDRAGMHEMAGDVRQRAENLERDLHGHHPERGHVEELHRMIRETHEQMDALRREFNALREDVQRSRRD